MLTRKHFRIVAEAMKTCKHDEATIAGRSWADAVWALAEAFALDNPRFDRAAFLHACGWKGGA